MKVLITGAKGQLGTCLREQLQHTIHQVEAHDVDTLDLLDYAAVSAICAELEPDVVINAAAYTAVDAAEENTAIADSLNHQVVRHLAAECAKLGALLVQVSTDFVFDGKKSSPYQVADASAPLSVYGQTKLDGEKAIQETDGCRGLIIRTAWLYSAHGNNFVKTMLRLMADRPELKIICDQIGTPTSANTLAALIVKAIDLPNSGGLYHWTDAGAASWYDFAVAIYEEGRAMGLLDKDVSVLPIPTEEYPTPATRPAYSVLDKSAAYQDFNMPAVHWRTELRKVLADLKSAAE